MTSVETTPDIEAWMKGEIQRPCEVWDIWVLFQCGEPAEFLVHAVSECGCRVSEFVCAECADWYATGDIDCEVHDEPSRATWIERIR